MGSRSCLSKMSPAQGVSTMILSGNWPRTAMSASLGAPNAGRNLRAHSLPATTLRILPATRPPRPATGYWKSRGHRLVLVRPGFASRLNLTLTYPRNGTASTTLSSSLRPHFLGLTGRRPFQVYTMPTMASPPQKPESLDIELLVDSIPPPLPLGSRPWI